MEEPTPYRVALTPWLIVHWQSPTQRTIIRRFRNRNDADNHLTTLRQLMPGADLKVIFEPPSPEL